MARMRRTAEERAEEPDVGHEPAVNLDSDEGLDYPLRSNCLPQFILRALLLVVFVVYVSSNYLQLNFVQASGQVTLSHGLTEPGSLPTRC
ncbi:hypothetical protein DIPPA_18408 [Diplonema papillatum]|nr:hypothetical protein DIPPA_18408 [Diplonema papillatum]